MVKKAKTFSDFARTAENYFNPYVKEVGSITVYKEKLNKNGKVILPYILSLLEKDQDRLEFIRRPKHKASDYRGLINLMEANLLSQDIGSYKYHVNRAIYDEDLNPQQTSLQLTSDLNDSAMWDIVPSSNLRIAVIGENGKKFLQEKVCVISSKGEAEYSWRDVPEVIIENL